VHVAVLWNLMPFCLVEIFISASACFSETTVHFYQATRRHIPSLLGNLCENMKSFLVRRFEGSNPPKRLKSGRKNNIRIDLKRSLAKSCGLFNVHRSVHRESLSVIVQQGATMCSCLYFYINCSTCFGW
jgi:hypothetical protein